MHDWRRDVRARLEPGRLDPAREAQLVDEISAHLDDRWRDLRARGVPAEEAVRQALGELESHDVLGRECQRLEAEVRSAGWGWRNAVAAFATDVRHAVRSVARRRAHAAAVALTLGVGMAATTTLYAVVDAIVIRPLPYPDAGRLVVVGLTYHGRETQAAGTRQVLYGASVADAFDWRDRARSFEVMAPVEQRTLFHDWGEGPELVDTAVVGEGFLDLFDATLLDGRLFVPTDFAADSPDIALLSHAAWVSRFGGARDVVGRQVAGLTIVGVLAPGLVVPEAVVSRAPDFWRPLRPADARYQSRQRRTSIVVGRLRPGVTLDTARRDADTVHAGIATEHPDAHRTPDNGRTGAGVNTLHAETVGGADRPLYIFLGAAALLLGLASVNAVNLQLLGALDRRGELAIRRALGADRARILRGLLVENIAVALVACLVGAVAAYAGVALFVHFGPESVPRLAEVAVNGRVLLVAALASVGVGLLVGFGPAVRATSTTAVSAGFVGETGFTAASGGSRLRTALVGVQMALATVLAVGAGLLFATFVRVSSSDLGFVPSGLATFTLPVKIDSDESSARVWDDVVDEVRRVPGLLDVAGTTDLPFTVSTWRPGVGVAGAEPGPILGGYAGFLVTPSYFRTIGARIVSGRDFTDGDRAASQASVIVNETFVRRFLPGRAPIGVPATVEGGMGRLEATIVGVVADIVEARVEDGVRPAVYLPHTQMPWMIGPTVVVRSDRAADSLLPDLRRAAAAYDGTLPVIGLGLMQDRVGRATVDPRFRAALFAAFATAALCLAAIGLYGSLAHAVGRRRRELGIRMALGADNRQVFRLVIRQGVLVGGAGLAAGLAGAAVFGRFIESFLFGVTAREPGIFIITAAVLLAVSLLAVVTPARRAAAVDVMRSLRGD